MGWNHASDSRGKFLEPAAWSCAADTEYSTAALPANRSFNFWPRRRGALFASLVFQVLSSHALPATPPFPVFQPYSPATDLTPTAFAQSFRAPIMQRYSLNLQTALAANWMLEVGYQGSRGTKLLQSRSFNQALAASPSNPIRGQTTNDLGNICLARADRRPRSSIFHIHRIGGRVLVQRAGRKPQ